MDRGDGRQVDEWRERNTGGWMEGTEERGME